MAVNIVADLFCFVTENGINAAVNGHLHEIGKKAVKLDAGMRWSSEADAAEDADFHPEVAAIFLGHQVGGSRPVSARASRAPAVPVHRPEGIRKPEEARQRTLVKKKAEAAQKTQEVQKLRKASPTGTPPPEQARSEVAAVMDLRTLSTCPVPIHVVVNRESDRDGHRERSIPLLSPSPWPLVRNIGCARALKSDIGS